MTLGTLDRNRYVAGDVSAHVGFLNCERVSDRSHIHEWQVDAHYHEGLAQLFVFGEGRIEGRVDHEPCSIDGPAVVWIPALCNHAFEYPRGITGWVLTVPTANIARLSDGKLWLDRWISRPQIVLGPTHGDAVENALRWAQRIENEKEEQGEERYAALEALFFLLLISLHRGLADAEETLTRITDRRQELASRFQQMLDRNFDETRSVGDYASMLSITPTHLSRSIKAVTGRTAGELIHDRVMLEAKRQLVFSDRPIADIAYDLRFSSPSYFSRFFATRTGETPTAFRERSHKTPVQGEVLQGFALPRNERLRDRLSRPCPSD
ncbi:helix-turn-helix domain-containing protein [Novosphingobium sp.]|uniref:helix-turn-helix domain-containing protein n=1 Tax=Novosphingobium sp. TaxID=1874826 RepID=UPI002FE0B299